MARSAFADILARKDEKFAEVTDDAAAFTASSKPDHNLLMPAVRITVAHLSVWSAMSLPNWVVVIEIGRTPRSMRRFLTSGAETTELISLLSMSMIATEVSLGAQTPNQLLAS